MRLSFSADVPGRSWRRGSSSYSPRVGSYEMIRCKPEGFRGRFGATVMQGKMPSDDLRFDLGVRYKHGREMLIL